MTPEIAGISDTEWQEIIIRLRAFFRTFTKDKHWFRGTQTETYLWGKSIDDYVYDAIGEFLKNPSKFDPKKGALIQYLEYSILRRLISNDLVREENETTIAVYEKVLQRDADDDTTAYYDRLVPFTEALFDDDIDYDIILKDIQKEVQKDSVCETIFLGLYMEGMTRAEVIREFGLSPKEFDNGNKRLKTIFRDIALKYA